jgi:hypothetical protein
MSKSNLMLFCHIVEFVIYKLNIILIKQMLKLNLVCKGATYFFVVKFKAIKPKDIM